VGTVAEVGDVAAADAGIEASVAIEDLIRGVHARPKHLLRMNGLPGTTISGRRLATSRFYCRASPFLSISGGRHQLKRM
jgi:hypothetical protein